MLKRKEHPSLFVCEKVQLGYLPLKDGLTVKLIEAKLSIIIQFEVDIGAVIK